MNEENAVTELPVPRTIFATISKVQKDLSEIGVAKTQQNTSQGWKFRGIDDLLNALSGVLAKNHALVLPNLIDKKRIDAPKGNHWLVTIDWTFFNKEGDSYTSRCAGEAVDFGDKGLSKAVTASYKYFLFNALCIPLVGKEFGDADYDHPEDEFEDTDTKQAAPKNGPKKKTTAKTKLKAVEPSKPKVSLAVIQKQIEKDIGYKSICIKPSTHDEAGEFEITIEADLDKLREVTKKYMRKHPEQKGTLQGLTSGYAKAIELKEKRQKENDEREKQKAS